MADSRPEAGGASTGTGKQFTTEGSSATGSLFRPPSITLPKEGGAIRGIGEKLLPASSLAWVLCLRPLQSVLAAPVSIYSSPSPATPTMVTASINFGWVLNLSHITRKTNRWQSFHDGGTEPDVFMLYGVKALLPVLVQFHAGKWELQQFLRTIDGQTARSYARQPLENRLIESFNGSFRSECLDRRAFADDRKTQVAIEQWRQEKDPRRPHNSSGYLPPAVFRD